MIDENVCDAGFCNHIYSDRFRFETFNLKLSAWIFQFEIILRVLGSRYWKFRKLILAESNRTASIEGPLEDFFREILIEKFSMKTLHWNWDSDFEGAQWNQVKRKTSRVFSDNQENSRTFTSKWNSLPHFGLSKLLPAWQRYWQRYYKLESGNG